MEPSLCDEPSWGRRAASRGLGRTLKNWRYFDRSVSRAPLTTGSVHVTDKIQTAQVRTTVTRHGWARLGMTRPQLTNDDLGRGQSIPALLSLLHRY